MNIYTLLEKKGGNGGGGVEAKTNIVPKVPKGFFFVLYFGTI